VLDKPGVELLAQELREAHADAVLATDYAHQQGKISIAPESIGDVLEFLRGKGYQHLMSVHGVDYYPEEPRLGVQYELLDRDALTRLTVRLRVPLDAAVVPSVTARWPTANHQEREVYDMFGVEFDGHPDLRRILMPEDYEGFPQRRDFPLGGEPVLFTNAESAGKDYTMGTDRPNV
jgi:NADH-quinone oxidoreductase subunit C